MTTEAPRTLLGAIEAVLSEEEELGKISTDIESGRRRMRLLADARVVLNGWRAGAVTTEVARHELDSLVKATRAHVASRDTAA